MKTVINFMEILFFLGCALHGTLYYTGRLKYTGNREEKRKERVEKYGLLILVSIAMMTVAGLGLLLMTLRKIF